MRNKALSKAAPRCRALEVARFVVFLNRPGRLCQLRGLGGARDTGTGSKTEGIMRR